ncbi:MAG: hypothetical protein NZT92_08550 [Abditibacteriales bacterium]|nr:hypothetical protein [Abditibacteriales bacterium]MDW8366004.1 hypothetical protein [Abditibacteriales bacterium]
MRCDASGNIYFRGGQFTLKIDPQFTQAQVLKEHLLDAQGFRYSYRCLPPEQEVEGLVYGIDGSLITTGAIKDARP